MAELTGGGGGMRRVRYQVASSLDGYIAGPNGEFDWIIMDPDIDFEAIFRQFDTLLMGRRTYELMQGQGGPWGGMRTVVFSRTLRAAEHPQVTVVGSDAAAAVKDLQAESGKDIWLFGGGELFRSLLEAGCVDTVEPAVIPVLLGGGIPLLPSPAARRSLELTGHRTYKSGIVLLEYAIKPAGKARRGRKAGKRPG
jgi:dihydrofolate reductase